MEQIISFLDKVKLARKQTHQNMTLFPLLAPDGHDPAYLTLEEALGQDLIRITEVSSAGSVPELRLINSGRKSVLIVEGEEMVGAKQNRIVNSTFLVAGKSDVIIPVSCVEQGRWNYRSRKFSSGAKIMHASLRRKSQRDVNLSLAREEGYRSDQGGIWEDIQDKSSRLKAPSATGAMADMFECFEDSLEDYEKGFRPIECQVGMVFAINGQILGLEAFGYYETMAGFFVKLVKSYALDALDWRGEETRGRVQPEKVRRFLSSVSKSQGEEYPSLGLGKNIRFEARSVSGAALVDGDRVLHLSAFKKERQPDDNEPGFGRFSQRRRFRN